MRLVAWHCRLQVLHGFDGGHVGLRTLALNLKIVEAFTLVQRIWISGTAALVSYLENTLFSIGSWLLRGTVIAALRWILRLIVLVVDEALLLKEVAAACLSGLKRLICHRLQTILLNTLVLLEGVVLNVNLPMVES